MMLFRGNESCKANTAAETTPPKKKEEKETRKRTPEKDLYLKVNSDRTKLEKDSGRPHGAGAGGHRRTDGVCRLNAAVRVCPRAAALGADPDRGTCGEAHGEIGRRFDTRFALVGRGCADGMQGVWHAIFSPRGEMQKWQCASGGRSLPRHTLHARYYVFTSGCEIDASVGAAFEMLTKQVRFLLEGSFWGGGLLCEESVCNSPIFHGHLERHVS